MPSRQSWLRSARVFACGTGGMGGMGGARVNALVHAGTGNLARADIDTFEISNLNRQVFAFTDTVGQPKAAVTAEISRRINPELNIEMIGKEWPSPPQEAG